MTCKNCGNKISEEAKFCPECGAKVGMTANSPKSIAEQEKIDYKSLGEDELRHYAETGDSKAQYELGERYYYGTGIEENENEARKWYQKAADNGSEDAKDRLEELEIYSPQKESKNEGDVFEMRRQIVDKYINQINKGYNAYDSKAVSNMGNSSVLKNARSHIAKGAAQSDILGFIDTTVFGNGKAGLVFTKTALYEKSAGTNLAVNYEDIEMENGDSDYSDLVIKGGRNKGMLSLGDEHKISSISFHTPILKKCLQEIKDML